MRVTLSKSVAEAAAFFGGAIMDHKTDICLNTYDLKQQLKSDDSKNLIICKGMLIYSHESAAA